MQQLEFPYYGNVFLDNGTVALYQNLRAAENAATGQLRNYQLQEGAHFGLVDATAGRPEHLWIRHERLFELLEDLYYTMGQEVYDTYTDKQKDEGGNLYFTPDGESATRFPKMNTYGFTELLTNNAQGVTRRESNTRKFKDIESENPALAQQLDAAFTTLGIKRLQKIYFTEPYTKITRLEKPTAAHFAAGPQRCYLTGEQVKKLVDAQNVSPFLSSSMGMFNSLLSTSDKKISWKALYVSRFAAAACLYQYPNKLREALNVYFLHADSLRHLHEIFTERIRRGLMLGRETDILRTAPIEFLQNFKASEALGKPNDFVGVYETLFVVLYSLREQVLRVALPTVDEAVPVLDKTAIDPDDPMEAIVPVPLRGPLALYFIRAESFAATMRPKVFDKLFNFHYAIGLIGHLTQQLGPLKPAIQGLKIIKPSLRNKENSFRQERQLRERVLSKMLQGQSILADMDSLFYDCYGYLLDGLNDSGSGISFKQYQALFDLTISYETLTNSIIMEKTDLQKLAVRLGSQLGRGILEYNVKEPTITPPDKDQIANAKQGRKYIVRLRKARRFSDFLEQLQSVQTRYYLFLKRDFLDNVSEIDFPWVKQFILLSAMNQLNRKLNPRKPETAQPAA